MVKEGAQQSRHGKDQDAPAAAEGDGNDLLGKFFGINHLFKGVVFHKLQKQCEILCHKNEEQSVDR